MKHCPLSFFLNPGNVCRLCEVGAKPDSESCVWCQPWLPDASIKVYHMQGKTSHRCFLLEVVSVLHCCGRLWTDSRAKETKAGSPSSCHNQHRWPQDPTASVTCDKWHGREPGHHAPCRCDQNHGREGPQTGAAQWTQGSSRLPADERQADPRRAAEAAGETKSKSRYVVSWLGPRGSGSPPRGRKMIKTELLH